MKSHLTHLSLPDAPYGLAVTGNAGSGKTALLTALWATDACDRAQPSFRDGALGERNTLVFIDTKGSEVASLQQWAALSGDQVTLVDVGDPGSFAIDFFDPPGDLESRASLMLNAMVYAFGEGAIQSRSMEVLHAVLTGALAVDPEVLAVAREQVAFTVASPIGQQPSPVHLAHILCGGQGDPAAEALYAAIAGEAVRRSSLGSPRATDLTTAAARLAVFFAGPSASARRSTMEAARNIKPGIAHRETPS